MLDHENHSMQDKNDVFENYRHLTQRNTGGGAIFTCAGFRVAIMWSKTFYLILTVAIIKDFTIVMEKQRFWNLDE